MEKSSESLQGAPRAATVPKKLVHWARWESLQLQPLLRQAVAARIDCGTAITFQSALPIPLSPLYILRHGTVDVVVAYKTRQAAKKLPQEVPQCWW